MNKFWELETDDTRGFYALLATDVGRLVVSFLARRKGADSLSWKILKSVTIFGSDEVLESSASEDSNIDTSAVLLFEVVEYDKQYHTEVEIAENLYGEGNCPPIPTNARSSNTMPTSAGYAHH
jgi:hypothetical protein